jgi:hypothetical protein
MIENYSKPHIHGRVVAEKSKLLPIYVECAFFTFGINPQCEVIVVAFTVAFPTVELASGVS